MVAIFLGEDSIRDTIAFPKTQKGVCLLSGSPAEVSPKQLDEIFIKTNVPKPVLSQNQKVSVPSEKKSNENS